MAAHVIDPKKPLTIRLSDGRAMTLPHPKRAAELARRHIDVGTDRAAEQQMILDAMVAAGWLD